MQMRAVGKLATLPKRMLPMRLQLFKQLLLKGPSSLRPATAGVGVGVLDRPTTVLDRDTTIQTMPRGSAPYRQSLINGGIASSCEASPYQRRACQASRALAAPCVARLMVVR